MKSLVFSVFVFAAVSAQAVGPVCGPSLLEKNVSYARATEICRAEGAQQGREHLLAYLGERENNCRVLNQNKLESDGYRQCFSEILSVSFSVLSCTTSAQRQTEVVNFSRLDFERVIEEHGRVDVPAHVKNIFRTLVHAALKTQSLHPLLTPRWEILGYKDSVANALAGADGQVIASSALWEGKNAFSDGEIAGILAHEIVHVLQMHNLEFGCKTLEWMDADIPLEYAYENFMMDFNPFSERALSRGRISQKNEFEADLKATDILRAAGMDPLLMAQALKKLASITGQGGMSSGSHPGFDDRIKRVSDVK
ncbi:Beta-barrel assembly-enhancing protease [compost metagenome]